MSMSHTQFFEALGQKENEEQLYDGHGLLTRVHDAALKPFRNGQTCVSKAEPLQDVISAERLDLVTVGGE